MLENLTILFALMGAVLLLIGASGAVIDKQSDKEEAPVYAEPKRRTAEYDGEEEIA